MHWIHRVWCFLTGQVCDHSYTPHRDPLVRRFARIERGIERESTAWRPRDLIDPR